MPQRSKRPGAARSGIRAPLSRPPAAPSTSTAVRVCVRDNRAQRLVVANSRCARTLGAHGCRRLFANAHAHTHKAAASTRLCMRACACVCACVCVRACARAWVRARVCARLHASECAHARARTAIKPVCVRRAGPCSAGGRATRPPPPKHPGLATAQQTPAPSPAPHPFLGGAVHVHSAPPPPELSRRAAAGTRRARGGRGVAAA